MKINRNHWKARVKLDNSAARKCMDIATETHTHSKRSNYLPPPPCDCIGCLRLADWKSTSIDCAAIIQGLMRFVLPTQKRRFRASEWIMFYSTNWLNEMCGTHVARVKNVLRHTFAVEWVHNVRMRFHERRMRTDRCKATVPVYVPGSGSRAFFARMRCLVHEVADKWMGVPWSWFT